MTPEEGYCHVGRKCIYGDCGKVYFEDKDVTKLQEENRELRAVVQFYGSLSNYHQGHQSNSYESWRSPSLIQMELGKRARDVLEKFPRPGVWAVFAKDEGGGAVYVGKVEASSVYEALPRAKRSFSCFEIDHLDKIEEGG